MKNILITGVNGFIGTHCYNYFLSKGNNVYGIDICTSDKSNCLTGNISQDLLESFNMKFDLIIHLAGSGSVSQANKDPENEEKKTVDSTRILIQFIKEKCPDAKLLYASSAAVYGNDYSNKISEDSQTDPFSTYGTHKLKVEKLLETESKNNNLKCCIIRFFSVYGEGLRKQVLWDFTNRLLDNFHSDTLQCYGTGEELRDFVHIDDVVKMFEFSSALKSDFEIINCGTGNGRSIKSILQKISFTLNYSGKLVFEDHIQAGNPMFLVADTKKASGLGYSPEITFDEGLIRYIEWLKGERTNDKK